MITTFITILAYIGAVTGTLAWLFCGWSTHDYQRDGNLQRTMDEIQHVERKWPVGYCLLIATISWAWLITTWVS